MSLTGPPEHPARPAFLGYDGTMKRIIVAIVVALLVVPALTADSIEGVWIGMTSGYPSFFRLQLGPDGNGRLANISRVSGDPEVRLYDVRWALASNGRKLDLELTPDIAGTPTPKLEAKVKDDEIVLEVVRRRDGRGVVAHLHREQRFREDWELAAEGLGPP